MMQHLRVMVGLICVTVLLVACGAASPAPSGGGEPPTVSAIFDSGQRATLPTATRFPTATRRPTRTPGPSAAKTSTITELVIYDDTLDPDWSVDNSWDVKVDLADTSHVYAGTVAAAVTPLQDYGAVLFAVKPEAQRAYPTTDVLGVSLWLNGGDGYLMPDDLTVTLIGSNDYPYWVKDDASVQRDDPRPFSETRLRYLGITQSVAPDKWVEAVVWIDKLTYDPNYNYVTSVYVKNDQGFRQTYYVDRVALLLSQP
jgi:hypothetical protein